MDIGNLLQFEVSIWFFPLSFFILGGGIKYVDEAFDRKTFNKTIAIIVAIGLGVLWATTMLADTAAATILLAVMLGVILSGKIDNIGHIAGCIVIIALLLLGGVEVKVWSLAALAVFAIADEFGNDYIDRKNHMDEWTGGAGKTVKYLFDFRCMMKIGVLALVVLGRLPWYGFVAFLLFDVAYSTVGYISKNYLVHPPTPTPSRNDE